MNAISYVLVVALVALAIIGGMAQVGAGLSTTFCTIDSHLHAGPSVSSCTTERKSQ